MMRLRRGHSSLTQPVILALAVSALLMGCGPAPMPIKEEQVMLNRLLPVPGAEWEFQGTVSDLPAPGARDWKLVTQGRLQEKHGTVFTQFSQVQSYSGGSPLMEECPILTSSAPLTADTAAEAALQIAKHLWPRQADTPQPEVADVRKGVSNIRDPESPKYIIFNLNFPDAPRRTPKSASIDFLADTGVCYRIYAQFHK